MRFYYMSIRIAKVQNTGNMNADKTHSNRNSHSLQLEMQNNKVLGKIRRNWSSHQNWWLISSGAYPEFSNLVITHKVKHGISMQPNNSTVRYTPENKQQI
jgi:hypothetical protein